MGYFPLGHIITIIIGIFGLIVLIWGIGGLVKQILEDYFEPLNFMEDDDDDNSHSIMY